MIKDTDILMKICEWFKEYCGNMMMHDDFNDDTVIEWDITMKILVEWIFVFIDLLVIKLISVHEQTITAKHIDLMHEVFTQITTSETANNKFY